MAWVSLVSVIENHWPLPSPKEEREISLRVDNKTFGVLVRSVSFQNNFKVLLCTKSTTQIFSILGRSSKGEMFPSSIQRGLNACNLLIKFIVANLKLKVIFFYWFTVISCDSLKWLFLFNAVIWLVAICICFKFVLTESYILYMLDLLK